MEDQEMGSSGGGGGGEISLREWLDRPGRTVDRVECLHVFRQVADAVGLAHSQGVVVANARPSCFVISSLNRVSFIESAPCSSSDDCDDDVSASVSGESSRRNSKEHSSYEEYGDGGGVVSVETGKKGFPLKQILMLEYEWYTSPEEGEGSGSGTGSFASDIYRLGVILFEIFCTFESLDEKLKSMSNLRHRVLPPQLLLKWSKEASFCLWLLHPQPDTRPRMSEVLQSEFLNGAKIMLEEREAAIKLKEKIEDQELLLEFLLNLQRKKRRNC
ncbi:protein SPA1-RELATED 3-like [Iris pallida]|uniref:Protein SPA1-RELATED 3-like n=1 Tax=Iris pallida TaxID=29817 RepID=A0AAX6G7A1_IRIPA|nr:protein SPA1-RELATED 3-like [Iris pallida]